MPKQQQQQQQKQQQQRQQPTRALANQSAAPHLRQSGCKLRILATLLHVSAEQNAIS